MASDTFTGSNGDPLAADWATNAGSFEIQSNGASPNTAGECAENWEAHGDIDAQESEGTVGATTSGEYLGVGVRMSVAEADTRIGYYSAPDDARYVYRIVDGAGWTQLASDGTVFVATDVINLAIDAADNWEALTNDANSMTGTDGTIATGSVGVIGYGTGNSNYLDDWTDNIAAAGTAPEFIINRRRFQGTRPRNEHLLQH